MERTINGAGKTIQGCNAYKTACDIHGKIAYRENSGFNRLIRLANPDIKKPIEKYSIKHQVVISDFTRIFNLKQLIYILTTYDNGISKTKHIVKILKKECEKLLTDFNNKYTDDDYMGYMDIYRLMGQEIKENFAGSGEVSVACGVHRIALESFRLEKDFKFREWDWKTQEIKRNPLLSRIYKDYRQRAEQEKCIWNEFEKDYKEYVDGICGGQDDSVALGDGGENLGISLISGNKGNVSQKCSHDYTLRQQDYDEKAFYMCMAKQKVQKITYTDKVIKHTIQFYSFIQQNPNITVARTFNLLFAQYSKKMDVVHADMCLVAGHIHYFRLINISKIMLMVDRFGMEFMYMGYDIMSILQKPLMDSENEVPELMSVHEEEMEEIIASDIELLLGDEYDISDLRSLNLLFCCYIELESVWNAFEIMRASKYAEGISGYLVLRARRKAMKLVNGYLEYYMDKSDYVEFINKTNGKIIDFPLCKKC